LTRSKRGNYEEAALVLVIDMFTSIDRALQAKDRQGAERFFVLEKI
jgi:hypothetical protein